MSCSSPLIANISAKPLPGASLSWVYYGHWQGPLPGALFFTHNISQAIESVAATDSVFLWGYGAIEAITGFANETVIDFDAHDRFAVDYFFLMDDDFLNQRVDQFLI